MCLQMITKTKKIFIGGLSATSTVDDMKAYFEQFGKVPYGGGPELCVWPT